MAKQSRMQTLLIILMVLMPILNQYQVFQLTFFEMFSTLVVFYGLIKNRGQKLKIANRAYGFFSIYILMFSLIFSLRYVDLGFSSALMRFIKFTIVTVFILSISTQILFDIELIRKIYKYVLYIVSLILVIQLILYYFMGKPLYAIIPNLTLNYNDGMNSSVLIRNNLHAITAGYYFRPSSVFLEPAHYAIFSIPGIVITLFTEKISRKDIVLSIFFTICSILTTSSLALVGCAICWITFLLFRKDLWKKSWNKMILLVSAIIPLTGYFLIQQGGVLTSINIKLASLANMSTASSTSMRLTRGISYYKQMDFISQIFGTGYGNLTSYYYKNGIYIIGDTGFQVSYMNGISTILCSFGIIGVGIFIGFIVSSYKKGTQLTKSIIICLLTVMFGSDMFDSTFYYIFILLILGNNKYLKSE
ncbi:MAG: hypothetical protein Q4F05_01595 [bacterium]|nr:hypothetical protein [bacterium]